MHAPNTWVVKLIEKVPMKILHKVKQRNCVYYMDCPVMNFVDFGSNLITGFMFNIYEF